jgi:hypothetical protein
LHVSFIGILLQVDKSKGNAMKAMKALLMTRHFDRSGRADQVASHLGPKSGMFLGTVLRITSKLCNLVCKIGKLGLILELAFWTLLAPLSFACSIVSLAVSCLCNMECSDVDKIEGWLRFMFGS